VEKSHDKGLPEDAMTKASEGVLCLLEAVLFSIKTPYQNIPKTQKRKEG